jgi:hypothetical protein
VADGAKGQHREGRWDTCVLASNLVRILAITVAGLALLVPELARADKRANLQSEGEKAAKEGRYADAIESFKQADEEDRRAAHACLISLAYTRRELWSQAQLWMGQCHARATTSDPMPDWVPQAEQLIASRLKTANVVAVAIDVTPSSQDTEVWVSSFAPDERFKPQTIYLAPGTHVIFAKVDGVTRQETIDISPSEKAPRKVVIDFTATAAPTGGGTTEQPDGSRVVQPTPASPSTPSNTLSNSLLIGGGVVALAGVFFQVKMGSARDTLDKYGADSMTPDYNKYKDAEPDFDRYRTLSIASYVVGAGLLVTGYFVRHTHKSETTVSAVPLPEGGGFVSIGWHQ